jgi:hypothetical protein
LSGRIARVDDLERYPISGQDGLTWRPVRRHFDIKSFGVNAYTAEEAGQRVVEEHREDGGHEELYVVISGRATFMVDGEEHDAPTGTLVHCTPGTLRGAIAAEPGTTVLGIGAKQGEIFQPAGSGSSPARRCSSRATRRARGGSSRPESRPIRARGRGRSTSHASKRGSGTARRPSNSSNARLSSTARPWRSTRRATRTSRRSGKTRAS